jgi:hypothetical protein
MIMVLKLGGNSTERESDKLRPYLPKELTRLNIGMLRKVGQ